jgi:SAM-dependent methyltransferase
MRICLGCEQRFRWEDWRCPSCRQEPVRQLRFYSYAPEISAGGIGYKSQYYGQLAEVEAGNFWFTSRNRLLCWALKAYFPAFQSFLEIGCGTGFVLQGVRAAFPGVRLAGSDALSDGLVFAARRVPDATLFQMDARRMPFEEEFDVIGAFDVLEHIGEDGQVLQQMYQAVKTGGGVIITVPQHPWMWSTVDSRDGHCRRYECGKLCQLVEAAGFRVEVARSFVSLLLPLMLGVRLLRCGASGDDMTEFNIDPRLNMLLKSVMALEYRLIRRGVSFPVGGSLLLVGRKGGQQNGRWSGASGGHSSMSARS